VLRTGFKKRTAALVGYGARDIAPPRLRTRAAYEGGMTGRIGRPASDGRAPRFG
jgi:hypothetical protein